MRSDGTVVSVVLFEALASGITALPQFQQKAYLVSTSEPQSVQGAAADASFTISIEGPGFSRMEVSLLLSVVLAEAFVFGSSTTSRMPVDFSFQPSWTGSTEAGSMICTSPGFTLALW